MAKVGRRIYRWSDKPKRCIDCDRLFLAPNKKPCIDCLPTGLVVV